MAPPGEHWARRLEAETRRPLDAGARHPDRCPKLTLHGAAFAIPPRAARVRPAFGPAGVEVGVDGGDDWPAANELLRLAPLKAAECCPTCGRAIRAELEVDADEARQFLAAAFDLAARLLDCQYRLDDHQKEELLSFPVNQPPAWLGELLNWCGAAC